MDIAIRKWSLVLFASVALHGFAAADDLVVVARNPQLGDAVAKTGGNCDPALMSQFLVDRHGPVKYLFERSLIDGDDPGWYPIAMKVASRLAGAKPVKLGDLPADEQSALRRLLLAGPVNRAPYLREALKNPDFRVGFGLVLRARFQAVGQTIPQVVEFVSDKFFEELETPNFAIPPAESYNRRQADRAEEPGFVAVFAESKTEVRNQTLRRMATNRLELHRQEARARSEKVYEASVADTLAQIQGGYQKWDGAATVKVGDVPNMAGRLESAFETDFSALGFASPKEAKAFARGATMVSPRVSLVVYWAGQGEHGRHSIGYNLAGIRP